MVCIDSTLVKSLRGEFSEGWWSGSRGRMPALQAHAPAYKPHSHKKKKKKKKKRGEFSC
jgi:hypothetical protein